MTVDVVESGLVTGHTFRRRIVGLGLIVSAFIALLGWALASPAGSSPDDNFHLNSIWCANSSNSSLCAPGSNPAERVISASLANVNCYQTKPAVNASCQGDLLAVAGTMLKTKTGNFEGLYPPGFYEAMGLFAGNNVEASVIVIRIVNVIFFLGAMTVTYLLASRRLKVPLLASAVITFVPLGMFVLPSTNPSSWALISAATVWVSSYSFFVAKSTRAIWILGALVSSTMAIGFLARADAAIFGVFALGLGALLASQSTTLLRRRTLLPIALAAAATVSYFAAGQSSAGFTNGGAQNMAFVEYLGSNLVRLPSLWIGAFGNWGLGWFDTEMPPLVWVFSFGVFASLLIFGLASMNWRKRVAIGITLALLAVLPVYLVMKSSTFIGDQVQPRYILPLLIILAGVTLFGVKGRPLRINTEVLIVLGVALTVANSVALHANLRRYVVGASTPILNIDAHISWWWLSFMSPMQVWAIGTLGFVSAIAALIVIVRRAQRGYHYQLIEAAS